jgi:hypothetical protein
VCVCVCVCVCVRGRVCVREILEERSTSILQCEVNMMKIVCSVYRDTQPLTSTGKKRA